MTETNEATVTDTIDWALISVTTSVERSWPSPLPPRQDKPRRGRSRNRTACWHHAKDDRVHRREPSEGSPNHHEWGRCNCSDDRDRARKHCQDLTRTRAQPLAQLDGRPGYRSRID
jgi:hypothetical protein